MYQMATVFNNAPNNTNLELVLDIDSLCLPGVSEGGTSKPLHFNYNPNVSISWCRHLRHSDNALIGTANVFHGTITAEVTLNEDGTIATIQVDTSCEHADYGAKVGTDEAFLAQFIGKMDPFTLGEGIDAVTGATGSSKSAVDAINDAVK